MIYTADVEKTEDRLREKSVVGTAATSWWFFLGDLVQGVNSYKIYEG